MTYYSHFRVLGNLAKIFGLNRGKTQKKNANFDFWSLISKFHNFRKPTFVKAWWRDVEIIAQPSIRLIASFFHHHIHKILEFLISKILHGLQMLSVSFKSTDHWKVNNSCVPRFFENILRNYSSDSIGNAWNWRLWIIRNSLLSASVVVEILILHHLL